MSLKTFIQVASVDVALGVAATPVMATPPNLVLNGSFESGLSNWTIGGTTGDPFLPVAIIYNSTASYPTSAFGESVPPNNAPTNSPDPVGTHAAYFVSDFANNESLSQSVFLTPGVYEIGFSAYLPANGFNNVGDATFTGDVGGVTLANFAASTGTARVWQTFQGSTTITTAGIYPVDFVFNTNLAPSKDVVIDQVYVIAVDSPVPEPATIVLCGTALLGLGLARHVRRRT